MMHIPLSGLSCDPYHHLPPRLTKWSCGREARALIEGASFGPETVKAICEAFDQTWARLAPIFSDVPGEIETVRIRLAEAILSVTTEGSTDVVALKTNALYAMARHYSSRFRRE
jgi:hypothetical protein